MVGLTTFFVIAGLVALVSDNTLMPLMVFLPCLGFLGKVASSLEN
jgi:hypothetical protein